jgi:hypothetical protein
MAEFPFQMPELRVEMPELLFQKPCTLFSNMLRYIPKGILRFSVHKI